MTNEEMTSLFAQSGVATAEIEKISERFDAVRITEIVEASSTPQEAFENLHAFYPELEVSKMQKQCDFIMEQVEGALKEQNQGQPVELTENELENVAGGGWFSDAGNWFKKNWKTVVAVGAVVVGGALVATGVGCMAGAAVMALAAPAVGGLGVSAGVMTLAFGGMGAATAGVVIGGAGYCSDSFPGK